MKDMVMQMTGSNGVLSVPNEHLPGLYALVLVGPVVWMALAGLRALAARETGWAVRVQRRLDGLSFAAKVVLLGTLVGALVHAVIVPTHWADERVTAILFVVDAVGFALAFWWTFMARRYWRVVAVAMLGGTACFYAFYILRGWETMDLVGLVTTTIEAAAALVVLSPAASPHAGPAVRARACGRTGGFGVTPGHEPHRRGLERSGTRRHGRTRPRHGILHGGHARHVEHRRIGHHTLGRPPLPADDLAGGRHRVARQHVLDDDRHEDGRAQLHGATDVRAATGGRAARGPDGGGRPEVHEPRRREGGRVRPGHADGSADRALHQPVDLPFGPNPRPERHPIAGLCQHCARCGALCRHVPRAQGPDATATRRMSHPVAHPHRLVLQPGRRDGRGQRQRLVVCAPTA